MSAADRMFDTGEAATRTELRVHRIAKLIKAVADLVRRHNQAGRTIRQLRYLDDRLLSDIGVSRASVGRSGSDFPGIGDALRRFIDPRG